MSTVTDFHTLVSEFQAKNPGALFEGEQSVVCSNLSCAGMTLLSNIVTSTKSKRIFYGLNNEVFHRMNEAEVKDWKEFIATLENSGGRVCECGAITL